jgi:hypothetical protein
LLSTGTGLAPFLSIIKDPEVYENFEKVILVHGCRYINELTYQRLITHELKHNEYFGESVREKLIYYPAVTREPFKNYGRITNLLKSGQLMEDIDMPKLNLDDDRLAGYDIVILVVHPKREYRACDRINGSFDQDIALLLARTCLEQDSPRSSLIVCEYQHRVLAENPVIEVLCKRLRPFPGW